MRKSTLLSLIVILALGATVIIQASGEADKLAGVMKKADIDSLIGKLRSGELQGAQSLFEGEDGPYRVYTSYIENRKGAADIHALDSEIFLIMSGSAEFTLGGEVTDKEAKSENEYRGTTISGGTTYSVAAGDIISIPKGTAHQMNPGEGHILYIVIKIKG